MNNYTVMVLWDIDGTLLRTHGAGRRAFVAALRPWVGCVDVPHGRTWAGRTDASWVRLVARRCGVAPPPWPVFVRRYLRALRRELRQRPAEALPGASALVDALRNQSGVYQALLTGNLRQAAALKLRSAGYAPEAFRSGAFGDRPFARSALARRARARIEARVHVRPEARWIVVGDTPRDVAAARAIGAFSLAVATGGFRVDELRSAGADLAVADLTATSDLVEWMLGS